MTARFGAIPFDTGTDFQVWAPSCRCLEVIVEGGGSHPMTGSAAGIFSASIEGARPGMRYRYRLDEARELPDPASRYQPAGVHGPSQIIDPFDFYWTDAGWRGIRRSELAIYELHVGTFTRGGTFAGVESRLDALAKLGVTAIELMPIAEYAGRWNWGYDGVALFAPSHNYGAPDDLRRLVNAAHAHGLAVILDVVYNHFGPDGAHIHAFAGSVRTDRYQTPWGAGINFDGPDSAIVRSFLIDNAVHWIREYHIDGLRLDACHQMKDRSERHFLAELAEATRSAAGGREIALIAEDEHRELAILDDHGNGGFGFDAIWADDFHHHLRRAVAGDRDGYFQAYAGTVDAIAATLRSGSFFSARTGMPHERFVLCIQNHDQVGNRARGERLHHQIDLSVYRAISALLLLAPETPLLFMGQEWAATTPFLFFTDHEPALGRRVTDGRRAEFAAFSAFADPDARAPIPDPQDPQTFRSSQLNWEERSASPHAGVLRLYSELLRLRRTFVGAEPFDVYAIGDETIVVRRGEMLIAVRLNGSGDVTLREDHGDAWNVLMTTEDSTFAENGCVPAVDWRDGSLRIAFVTPVAVVMKTSS